MARRRRGRARARALRGAAVGGADAPRVTREALALIAADGDKRAAPRRARAREATRRRALDKLGGLPAHAAARAGTLWEEIAVLEQAAELVDLVIEVAPYAGTRASGTCSGPSPPQVAPYLAPAALIAARARARAP